VPLRVQHDVGARLRGQVAHRLAVRVSRARTVGRGVPTGEIVARARVGVALERLVHVVGGRLARHGNAACIGRIGREADRVGDGRPVRVEHRAAGGHGVHAAGCVERVALRQHRPTVQDVARAGERVGSRQAHRRVGVGLEEQRAVRLLVRVVGGGRVVDAAVAVDNELDLVHDPVGIQPHRAARGARQVLDHGVVGDKRTRAVGGGGPTPEGVAGARDALRCGGGDALFLVVSEHHVVQVARAAVRVELDGEVVRLEHRTVGCRVLGRAPDVVAANRRVVGALGGLPVGLVVHDVARRVNPVQERVAGARVSRRALGLGVAARGAHGLGQAVHVAARERGRRRAVNAHGRVGDLAQVLAPPSVDGARRVVGVGRAQGAELRGRGHLRGPSSRAHVPAHEGVAGLGGVGHAVGQVVGGPRKAGAVGYGGAAVRVVGQRVGVSLPDGIQRGVLVEHGDAVARRPSRGARSAHAPAGKRVARASDVGPIRQGHVLGCGGSDHLQAIAYGGALVGVEGQLLLALLEHGVERQVAALGRGQAALGPACVIERGIGGRTDRPLPAHELPTGLRGGAAVVARVGVAVVHEDVVVGVRGREGLGAREVCGGAAERPVRLAAHLVEHALLARRVAHDEDRGGHERGRERGGLEDGNLRRVVGHHGVVVLARIGPVGELVAVARGIRGNLLAIEILTITHRVGRARAERAARGGREAHLVARGRPRGVERHGGAIGCEVGRDLYQAVSRAVCRVGVRGRSARRRRPAREHIARVREAAGRDVDGQRVVGCGQVGHAARGGGSARPEGDVVGGRVPLGVEHDPGLALRVRRERVARRQARRHERAVLVHRAGAVDLPAAEAVARARNARSGRQAEVGAVGGLDIAERARAAVGIEAHQVGVGREHSREAHGHGPEGAARARGRELAARIGRNRLARHGINPPDEVVTGRRHRRDHRSGPLARHAGDRSRPRRDGAGRGAVREGAAGLRSEGHLGVELGPIGIQRDGRGIRGHEVVHDVAGVVLAARAVRVERPIQEAVARAVDAGRGAAGRDLVVHAVCSRTVDDGAIGRRRVVLGHVGVIGDRVRVGLEMRREGHRMIQAIVEGDILQVCGEHVLEVPDHDVVERVRPVGNVVAVVSHRQTSYGLRIIACARQRVDLLGSGAAESRSRVVAGHLAVATGHVGHGDVAGLPLGHELHGNGDVVPIAFGIIGRVQVAAQVEELRGAGEQLVVDEIFLAILLAVGVVPTREDVALLLEPHVACRAVRVLDVDNAVDLDGRRQVGARPRKPGGRLDCRRAAIGVVVDDEVAARHPLGVEVLHGRRHLRLHATDTHGHPRTLNASRGLAIVEPAQTVKVAGLVSLAGEIFVRVPTFDIVAAHAVPLDPIGNLDIVACNLAVVINVVIAFQPDYGFVIGVGDEVYGRVLDGRPLRIERRILAEAVGRILGAALGGDDGARVILPARAVGSSVPPFQVVARPLVDAEGCTVQILLAIFGQPELQPEGREHLCHLARRRVGVPVVGYHRAGVPVVAHGAVIGAARVGIQGQKLARHEEVANGERVVARLARIHVLDAPTGRLRVLVSVRRVQARAVEQRAFVERDVVDLLRIREHVGARNRRVHVPTGEVERCELRVVPEQVHERRGLVGVICPALDLQVRAVEFLQVVVERVAVVEPALEVRGVHLAVSSIGRDVLHRALRQDAAPRERRAVVRDHARILAVALAAVHAEHERACAHFLAVERRVLGEVAPPSMVVAREAAADDAGLPLVGLVGHRVADAVLRRRVTGHEVVARTEPALVRRTLGNVDPRPKLALVGKARTLENRTTVERDHREAIAVEEHVGHLRVGRKLPIAEVCFLEARIAGEHVTRVCGARHVKAATVEVDEISIAANLRENEISHVNIFGCRAPKRIGIDADTIPTRRTSREGLLETPPDASPVDSIGEAVRPATCARANVET